MEEYRDPMVEWAKRIEQAHPIEYHKDSIGVPKVIARVRITDNLYVSGIARDTGDPVNDKIAALEALVRGLAIKFPTEEE